MIRRAALAACAALAVVSLSAAAAAPGRVGAPAGGAPCPGASGLADKIPVLLVHGFIDGPYTWEDGGAHSMAAAIRAVPGVKVVPEFDYFNENTRWVTDGHIGPALAADITCLASASARQGGPGKVIIVAHSMGGLAVRCALDPACAGNAAKAAQVGLVVTLDTPNTGSPLAGTAPVKGHYKGTGGMVSALMASTCDSSLACRDGYGAPASQAARAMALGSAQLRNLAPLPGNVPLFAMAGQIMITDTMFGYPIHSWDIGDGVVLEGSALAEAPAHGAHTGPGSGQATISCGTIQVSQLDLYNIISSNPIPRINSLSLTCVHTSEITDPAWQASVASHISEYVASTPVLRSCPYLSAEQAGAAAGGQVTGRPPVKAPGFLDVPAELCEFDGPKNPGGGMYEYQWSINVSLTDPMPDARAAYLKIRQEANTAIPGVSNDHVIDISGIGLNAFISPAIDGGSEMYILLSNRIATIGMQARDGVGFGQEPPQVRERYIAAARELVSNIIP